MDQNRRRALAFNAVAPALKAHHQWLPLSVRRAVADAVLAAIADEPARGPVTAHPYQGDGHLHPCTVPGAGICGRSEYDHES